MEHQAKDGLSITRSLDWENVKMHSRTQLDCYHLPPTLLELKRCIPPAPSRPSAPSVYKVKLREGLRTHVQGYNSDFLEFRRHQPQGSCPDMELRIFSDR